MAGFPLMAFGAGLGRFAEQQQQMQAQRERTMMLQMQIQRFQQEMADRQEKLKGAEALWNTPATALGPVNPAAGVGSPGARPPFAPFGAGLPAASSIAPGVGEFGPGVAREPSGGLTRNGQPPDTTYGGMPAWRQPSDPGLQQLAQIAPELRRPAPSAGALPWRTDPAPASAYAEVSGPGAPVGGGTPMPSNIPPPRGQAPNAPPSQMAQAQPSPGPQQQQGAGTPGAREAPPDLQQLLDAVPKPDLRDRTNEQAFKDQINRAYPLLSPTQKQEVLKAQLERSKAADADRLKLAMKDYDTRLDAVVKTWEEKNRRAGRAETGNLFVVDGVLYRGTGTGGAPVTIGGQPVTGATTLAGGAETAAGGREKDIGTEIKRLDDAWRTENPKATKAEFDAQHFKHRTAVQSQMTEATVSQTRGGPATVVMRKALAEHPEWDATDALRYANLIRAQQATETRFGSGQGAAQMTSLNTVAHHLKLMEDYSRELRTGDTPFTQIPYLNMVIQKIAKERGLPEVTNFNVGRDILADEVVRLLTSTGGTEADRAGMQARLAASMSEYQQTGALTAFERFVAGRFQGLQQGYAFNDPQRVKFFQENLLTPEARSLFTRHGGGAAPGAQPGQAAPAALQAVPTGQSEPTATDPKTGKKLILRGGQWVPVQ